MAYEQIDRYSLPGIFRAYLKARQEKQKKRCQEHKNVQENKRITRESEQRKKELEQERLRRLAMYDENEPMDRDSRGNCFCGHCSVCVMCSNMAYHRAEIQRGREKVRCR